MLFDSNLNILNEALKTNKSKIDSKSVNSVPSEVGNIKDFLEQEYDIETFKNKILENIFVNKSYKEYTLSEIDIENIEKLAKEKFSTWDWIYGESPPFTIRNLMQLPNGSIAFKVEVERDGNINKISFEGDLVNSSEIIHFEKLLQGKKYYIDNVIDILKNIEISKYFVNVTPEELISLMFY